MIRMLIVGYRFGIRSEWRLCNEVHLNLAYRWFCHLGLDGKVPDQSTFSKNRHGRFRESDLFRRVVDTVVQRCIDKSERKDGTLSRSGFSYDLEKDAYICPEGKTSKSRRRRAENKPANIDEDGQIKYRVCKVDCAAVL